MKRSKKLNKDSKIAEKVKAFQHYEEAGASGSTGYRMQLCEVVVRDMILVHGILTSASMYARLYNEDDVRVKTRWGESFRIEIKHGAGALAYAYRCGMKAFTERTREVCLPGVDWVVYNRTADPYKRRTRMAMEYRVMRREDFLDALEEYCHGSRSKGFETATKFSKGGAQINIQSMYVDQFWEGLQNDSRAMCLWDFCTQVLGRDPRWDW